MSNFKFNLSDEVMVALIGAVRDVLLAYFASKASCLKEAR